jgi:hypothetical protein
VLGVAADLGDVLELAHHGVAVVLGEKGRDERVGLARRFIDASGDQGVEGGERAAVRLVEDGHRRTPLAGCAVPGERREKGQQLPVGRERHIDRR